MKQFILTLQIIALAIITTQAAQRKWALLTEQMEPKKPAADSSGIKLVPDNFRNLRLNLPSLGSQKRTVSHVENPDRKPIDVLQQKSGSTLPNEEIYYFDISNDGSLLWPSERSPVSMIALEGTGATESRCTSGAAVDLIRIAHGLENQEAFEKRDAVTWFSMKYRKFPTNEFEERDLKSDFRPLFEKALEKARSIKRITVNGQMGKIGRYDFDQKRIYLGASSHSQLQLFKDEAPFEGVFVDMDEDEARNLVGRSYQFVYKATGSIFSPKQTREPASEDAQYGKSMRLKVEELRIAVIRFDNSGRFVKTGEFPADRIKYSSKSR